MVSPALRVEKSTSKTAARHFSDSVAAGCPASTRWMVRTLAEGARIHHDSSTSVELEVRLAHDFARVVEGGGDHLAEGVGRVADRQRRRVGQALLRLRLLQGRDKRRVQPGDR